jgi:hypothetical protein
MGMLEGSCTILKYPITYNHSSQLPIYLLQDSSPNALGGGFKGAPLQAKHQTQVQVTCIFKWLFPLESSQIPKRANRLGEDVLE